MHPKLLLLDPLRRSGHRSLHEPVHQRGFHLRPVGHRGRQPGEDLGVQPLALDEPRAEVVSVLVSVVLLRHRTSVTRSWAPSGRAAST